MDIDHWLNAADAAIVLPIPKSLMKALLDTLLDDSLDDIS